MKLATRKNKTRDGELVVVSRDLKTAVTASDIAPNLQFALDNWAVLAPKLESLYNSLNQGDAANTFAFDSQIMASPLPRTYQWADGSAYVTHVELVRKARGAEMPKNFWTDPLMYQGGSDSFVGPRDDIQVIDESWGIDFEAEIAVVTGDVEMGVSSESAVSDIRLLMLVNDVTLRNLIPGELGKGFGFFQSKPASAFSPVAVTPNELGDAWQDGRVHLPLTSIYNGEVFGTPESGVDMTFNFPKLIEHAARTRHLAAGTIIGSGTVSNSDRSKGSSCLAERRMLEIIDHGEAKTPFMKFGDSIKIEMLDRQGRSIFGAIEQKVVKYEVAARQVA